MKVKPLNGIVVCNLENQVRDLLVFIFGSKNELRIRRENGKQTDAYVVNRILTPEKINGPKEQKRKGENEKKDGWWKFPLDRVAVCLIKQNGIWVQTKSFKYTLQH